MSDVMQKLQKWLVEEVPSWTPADPNVLAQYIVELLRKPLSRTRLKSETCSALAAFSDRNNELVNVIFRKWDDLKQQRDASLRKQV
ncbi:MAG: hypothetical protein MHM6MM_008812, partial [Cercozoa sp. M6MM]